MASQITKNRTMKMTLRRLLLAISLYTCRILRHHRYPDSGAASQLNLMSVAASRRGALGPNAPASVRVLAIGPARTPGPRRGLRLQSFGPRATPRVELFAEDAQWPEQRKRQLQAACARHQAAHRRPSG